MVCMRTMFRNHEENTMLISYEMMDIGNDFTKIQSLGGNGQEILCLVKTMSTRYEMVDFGNCFTKIVSLGGNGQKFCVWKINMKTIQF